MVGLGTMKKITYASDIVKWVALKNKLSQDAVSQILGATVKEIRSAVARGYRVQLTGFGTFYPSHRKARKGRNLQTGDTIDIPAMTLPRFTPGTTFKQAVRKSPKKNK